MGIDLLMLTDKNDTRDYYNAEMAADPDQAAQFASVPRLLPNSLFNLGFDTQLIEHQTFATTLPAGIHVEQRERADGTAELHLLRADGSPAHEDDVPDLDFGMHPGPVCRWLVVMWRLMQQPLAHVAAEVAPRPFRRQLQRRNLVDRQVSVVTLRRMDRTSAEKRDVAWSHRWIRRGHWRQQPYKVEGQWQSRAIWIHPTICGPEDKPILVRDRVYALRR